jgi:hypothetical protein
MSPRSECFPEARYVLDEWRAEYNHRWPHSGLGWQTPAAYAAKLVDRLIALALSSPTAASVDQMLLREKTNHGE